jgi:hypothetical protein
MKNDHCGSLVDFSELLMRSLFDVGEKIGDDFLQGSRFQIHRADRSEVSKWPLSAARAHAAKTAAPMKRFVTKCPMKGLTETFREK